MKFATTLRGYDALTRRLALAAGRQAESLMARRSAPRIATEQLDADLGAEAWPGGQISSRGWAEPRA